MTRDMSFDDPLGDINEDLVQIIILASRYKRLYPEASYDPLLDRAISAKHTLGKIIRSLEDTNLFPCRQRGPLLNESPGAEPYPTSQDAPSEKCDPQDSKKACEA